MASSFSRSLLIILFGCCNPSHAGSQIEDLTCAHYLGLSATTDAFEGLATEASSQSKVYQAGHTLGIAVRQYTMVNWVHGYLIGYADRKSVV